ncbi:hypothetical protein [Aliarcobacter butzleri]|uniref:hypothetical protein n=1 Tax=Aliarcobacter butzleri TaxID=28197 RepID=UPI003AF6B41B
MATANKIKRTYGKERTFGDVIYNPQTKSVFCNIELGFFGRTTLTLVKREKEGIFDGFDLMKSFIKEDQEQIVCVGKTFAARNEDGSIIEGITKGTFGLSKKYDKELTKNITDNSDALFITTHKLKEKKTLGDSGLLKIGYLSGQFGIEFSENKGTNNSQYISDEEIDEDEIPF